MYIDASDPACSSSASCTLHLHHALPSALFVDPYELQLRANEYTAYVAASKHGVDLEAPAFAVDPERAGREVRVDVKDACVTEGELEIDIPLHVRYLDPRREGDEDGPALVEVEPPVAFWACAGEEGGARITIIAISRYSTHPTTRQKPLLMTYTRLFSPVKRCACCPVNWMYKRGRFQYLSATYGISAVWRPARS